MAYMSTKSSFPVFVFADRLHIVRQLFLHFVWDISHSCQSGNAKMASEEQITESISDQKLISKDDRQLQKKLRNCGQEYISRSGRLMPAKLQPDVLCTCPQRCNEKISVEARMKLFTQFYKLGDQNKQNEFLRAHIRARAVQKRSPENKPPKRAKRRVSCKYQVPLLTEPEMHIEPGPSPTKIRLIEICQKAFMNIFVITEKRVRLQREKLILEVLGAKTIQRPSQHVATPEPPAPVNTEEPIDMRIQHPMTEIDIKILNETQHDIALVDNFFMNQLWKPEYINMAI